ncbi:PspA/IM30 family protein [uncultured Gammaproteobacteria bacterium]
MFSFLKSFVGVKGEQLGRDIVSAIVEMDPESATQAQLDQMEKDLDAAGLVIQKIRTDYEREVREADAANKRYAQMMSAAELLQAKLENPAVADKAGVEASMGKLIEQLERFKPEMEQENQDVVEVKALLDDAQDAYRAKAEALAQAKQKLDRAKHDMHRATMEKDRAEEKARRAAEVAGLRSGGGNKLNVAVEAMQRKADEARAQAGAAKLKATTLNNVGLGGIESDSHIAEAMKTAAGGSPAGASIGDRLAALKKK